MTPRGHRRFFARTSKSVSRLSDGPMNAENRSMSTRLLFPDQVLTHWLTLNDTARTKRALYATRNVPCTDAITPSDHEFLVSLLTGLMGTAGQGPLDLDGAEVKSSQGGNFDYQWQKDCGQIKHAAELLGTHFYSVTSNDYTRLSIHCLCPSQFRAIAVRWMEKINHDFHRETIQPKQRCRKSLSKSLVFRYGTLLLRIIDGRISHSLAQMPDESTALPIPPPHVRRDAERHIDQQEELRVIHLNSGDVFEMFE